MLSTLAFSLFFEIAQPSYATFANFFPEEILVLGNTFPQAQDIAEHLTMGKNQSLGPVIHAQAFFAMDITTGKPILSRGAFARRPIASIGKLVAAMIILDHHRLEEIVSVSKHASQQEPTKMWLTPGEKISVGSLLTGLLVGSANDAAVALAEFDAGTESAFVQKMNEKAELLGLANTRFSNVMGFDEPGSYSTAYDTHIFSRKALNYPFIRKIVALKETEVASESGETKHKIESTNELLGNPYFAIKGLKTGKTPKAGESFVSLAETAEGREILVVILDSPDRFRETKIILDWIFRNQPNV